jgi:hypothetical protein
MQVTINLTYSTCVVTIKQQKKTLDGYTYRGVSERGTVYQFTDKQIVRDESE